MSKKPTSTDLLEMESFKSDKPFSTEAQHVCAHCGKLFKRYNKVINHLRNVHNYGR